MPIVAPISASEWYTLLPSPTNATGSPRRSPNRSWSVNRSASVWHGCSRMVSPLTTGTSAWAASSTTTSCGPVRAMIPSTNRPRFRATSRDALPAAEHDALGEVDRVAAELGHRGLERDPRAQARSLEQHRERPPLERRLRVPPVGGELGLELGSPREQPRDLVGGQVRGRDEVAPTKRGGGIADGRHAVTVRRPVSRVARQVRHSHVPSAHQPNVDRRPRADSARRTLTGRRHGTYPCREASGLHAARAAQMARRRAGGPVRSRGMARRAQGAREDESERTPGA